MNQLEMLLTQFDEELKELAIECLKAGVRVDKAIRFTLDEVQPGQELDNRDRLGNGIIDVLACIENLVRFGVITNTETIRAIEEKKAKIIFFMQLSKDLGTFQGDLHNA